MTRKKTVGWRIDNKDVGSRYAMQNDNYLEFQDWEIAVLLAWHRMDPVSGKELKRMNAVSDFQHNRNPFIEYPCLAEYIYGVIARGRWFPLRNSRTPMMPTTCPCLQRNETVAAATLPPAYRYHPLRQKPPSASSTANSILCTKGQCTMYKDNR
jgi:hypothetical protein